MTKKEFRQFAIKKRNSLSSEERISFSNQILQHLINSEIYQDSKKIFMYLSFQSEVDTFQLLPYFLCVSAYLPTCACAVNGDGDTH